MQVNPNLLFSDYSLNKVCVTQQINSFPLTHPSKCSIPFHKRKTATWTITNKNQKVFFQLARGILHWIITEWVEHILTSNYKKQDTLQWNCVVWFFSSYRFSTKRDYEQQIGARGAGQGTQWSDLLLYFTSHRKTPNKRISPEQLQRNA